MHLVRIETLYTFIAIQYFHSAKTNVCITVQLIIIYRLHSLLSLKCSFRGEVWDTFWLVIEFTVL